MNNKFTLLQRTLLVFALLSAFAVSQVMAQTTFDNASGMAYTVRHSPAVFFQIERSGATFDFTQIGGAPVTGVQKLDVTPNDNIDNPIAIELNAIGYESIKYVASLTHTAEHLNDIIEVIAPQGKFGLIDDADVLDIMPFKRKCVSVHWEFMFTRSLFATEDMLEQHKLLAEVAKLIDNGQLRSTVANNFGMINAENLLKAHSLLESGKSKGKIVLSGF